MNPIISGKHSTKKGGENSLSQSSYSEFTEALIKHANIWQEHLRASLINREMLLITCIKCFHPDHKQFASLRGEGEKN